MVMTLPALNVPNADSIAAVSPRALVRIYNGFKKSQVSSQDIPENQLLSV